MKIHFLRLRQYTMYTHMIPIHLNSNMKRQRCPQSNHKNYEKEI